MKLKSLMLYLNSFSLRKNKITFVSREVSAFIALAEVFTYITSQIMRNTLFIRTHC